MKRISILLLSSALLLSSCHTLTKTARTADVGASLQSATVVDLVPATEQRITHTIEPTKDILRGGMDNVRQAVIHEALVEKGNNADVLLEPQYVVSKKKTLFGSKITSITVSGRPAYYTNFRVLDDSVWCNPVFRGVNMHQRSLPLAGMRSPIQKKKSNDSYTPAYRTKGFAMYLTPFVGASTFILDSEDTASGQALAAFLTMGYQLNPHLYLGIGAGFNDMDHDANVLTPSYDNLVDEFGRTTCIPLFYSVRVNLSKKRNTLFIDGKVGGCIYSGDSDSDASSASLGGTFGALALGYSFGNFDIALQEVFSSRSIVPQWSLNSEFGLGESIGLHLNQFGVSIGYRF